VELVGEGHLAERMRGIEAARAEAEAAAARSLQEAAARAAEAQAAADLAAAQAAAQAEAAARAAAASAKPAPKPAPAPAPKPAPKPTAPPPPPPPPGGISPAEIPSLAPAGKALVVTATRYGTSYATATAWQRDASGGWQVAYGPVPARLGWNGFAENRVRNGGTTPVGVFSLGTAFGPGGNPGTSLPWRQFDAEDWWVYDPADLATFNTWQRGRAPDARWSVDEAERLVDYGSQYAYAVVVNFNIPVVSTQSGGGIFVHVNGTGATAGCVSLRAADMLNVLRWLDSSARVALGPVAALRGR
jgi:L,D-peptidoglycan transpeptidase YkuD (ErfK/YbiS/YcfS/YnhG family)